MQTIKISIQFREDVDFGKGDIRQYSDTLYYSPEEYDKLSAKDIEDEKQKRINNWKSHVQGASKSVREPLKEEFEQELARQEEQVFELKQMMIAKGFLSAESLEMEKK